jgi:2-keto-4-pentenoate hydratase/2-oxohepta-3-ene-1,7-dioic acid hydratase in catechol pathway
MQLIRFDTASDELSVPGVLDNDVVYDLRETPLVTGEHDPLSNAISCLCNTGVEPFQFLDAPSYDLDDVSLRAPLSEGGRVICLGGVYRQHLTERNDPLVRVPSQWLAPDRAVVGSSESIIIPERVSENVVPAVELGVVIGKECKSIEESEVFDHIAGYTVCNDVTARTEWPGPMAYKLFETFWPTGPGITPAQCVSSPSRLIMTLNIDGEQICRGTTASMRFSIPFIVSYLSQIFRLQPGDVISTGDPGGVTGRLKPGVQVTANIESVGTLENSVVKQ